MGFCKQAAIKSSNFVYLTHKTAITTTRIINLVMVAHSVTSHAGHIGQKMVKLPVVIITFNEERNIGRCLESVSEIADEIVVVDSFSTDRTRLICEQYGVRFIEEIFCITPIIRLKSIYSGQTNTVP